MNPKSLLRKAEKLIREGDYFSAEDIYNSILKTYPKNKEAAQGLLNISRSSQSLRKVSETKLSIAENQSELTSVLVKCDFSSILKKDEWEFIVNYYEAGNLTGLTEYVLELSIKYPATSMLHNIAAAINYDLKDFVTAVSHFRRALIFDPRAHDTNLGIAKSLASLGHFEEAKEHLEIALEAEPDSLVALQYLGATAASLGLIEKAEEAFRSAIEKHPNQEDSYLQLVKLLQEKECWAECLTVLEAALVAMGRKDRILRMLVFVLYNLERIEDAFTCLDEVLTKQPGLVSFCSMRACLSNYIDEITSAEQFKIAKAYEESLKIKKEEIYSSWRCDAKAELLKIGFVSGDFWDHVVGRMLLRMLPHFNRSKFELLAFSTSSRVDEVSEKLKKEFSRWVEISSDGDFRQSAERIFLEAPNLLIDLNGHTQNNALPVFAYRPAPIQISWLGYFATTGLSAIDYKLVDNFVVPSSMEKFFTEKIYRLPHCFLCPSIPEESNNVNGFNIESTSDVLFGSVNRFNKINNHVVELWAKILNCVPKSRMILKGRGGADGEAGKRIASQFLKNGIDSDRLLFEDRSSMKDYFNILSKIDIVLDTFPFTGGVTTADALWMGTPVLVRKGRDTLVSFQGESIIRNAGMEEWIAEDEVEYVKKAVSFASDLKRLSNIRQEMLESVKESPLFDVHRFALSLEKALIDMWNKRITSEVGHHYLR